MNSPNIFDELSSSQQEIAFASANTKMLVLAGPGTGKTHTMLRRLVYLNQSEGLLPHRDILVVSFSRAAVAEIRSRLVSLIQDGAPDDLRFLNVRTFDSMATRLMTAADEDLDLSGLNYESRIALAVKRLTDPESQDMTIIRKFRHVIVDEIQDLVGLRAQLVQKILGAVRDGFTLLGDPAQGIYDYLVDKPSHGPTSLEFLEWLRQTWMQDLQVYDLKHNYRVASPSAEVANRARDLVQGDLTDGPQAYQTLREIISGLDSAGKVSEIIREEINPVKKRTALLCRTNADVMFSAHKLHEQGFPCLIPPSVEEKGIPAWVGRIFSTWTAHVITQPEFENRWQKLIGSEHVPDMAQAWNLLKALEGIDRQILNLDVLRNRLRKGIDWTFDSEAQRSNDMVLVTTIHQSKGREYDRVVILPPEPPGKLYAEDILEEARVLYVAATRAREQILRLGRQGLPVMYTVKCASRKDRYIGQLSESAHLFETGLVGDIDETAYVSTSLFPNSNLVQQVQELIWKNILPGARMVLIPQVSKGQVKFVLSWQRDAQKKPLPLGLMDNSYRIDLETFLRSKSADRRWHLPPLLTGPVVYERRTVILPPYHPDIHEPYATSGFCLGVAIKGVVQV